MGDHREKLCRERSNGDSGEVLDEVGEAGGEKLRRSPTKDGICASGEGEEEERKTNLYLKASKSCPLSALTTSKSCLFSVLKTSKSCPLSSQKAS